MPIHALILKLCGKALIKHLGKPELLQMCRLVQRAGESSAFSGFKAGLTATQSKNLITYTADLGKLALHRVFPSMRNTAYIELMVKRCSCCRIPRS